MIHELSRRVLLVCLFLFAVPSTGLAHWEKVLRSPFDTEAQARKFGGKGTADACKPLPRLPHKVESVAFYTDSNSSIIDESLYQRFLQLRKITVDEEDFLAEQNTKYIQAGPAARVAIAQCLRSHLVRFSEDDAFVGSDDIRGGGAVRLMSVTPLVTYLLIRAESGMDVDDDQRIRAWIARLMERLLWLEKTFKYDNNIEDWTAAAFSLGAVALNRPELLEHAIAVVEKKSHMVDGEGFLPLEMGRGQMSVEYSLSATQALSITVAVAVANGRDVLSEPVGHGLLNMMRRMVTTVNDPSSFLRFSDSTGAIDREHFDRQNLGWLEIYYRKTNDLDALRAICERRPLFSWRTGGDWFVLFGSPDQCSASH
jgi:hypothetical protein